MRTIKLGQSDLVVPVIAVGCFRLNRLNRKEAENHIRTALDLGVNFFDHAENYGRGECESLFADALGMNEALREKVIIQTKCGNIHGKMYDLSKEYILEAVDGSLKRLKTDYLDVLLLHRPDTLVEPDEVAEAFDKLYSSGKVHYFGVSNHNSMQIQLLKKSVRQPIVANQMEMSIANARMISVGINVNTLNAEAVDRDGSVLDFCRLNDITVQTWSPLKFGDHKGVFINNEMFPELNARLDKLADKYSVSNTAIAIAWLLRHPAKLQTLVGTMNTGRLKDCVKAADIRLTREEWYEIYLSAGHSLP